MPNPHLDQELIELIENPKGSYVVVGTLQEIEEGTAMIYDLESRQVSYFDECSEIHKKVVEAMVAHGVPVASTADELRRLQEAWISK